MQDSDDAKLLPRARPNTHIARTRARIQAARLISRLSAFVMGEVDPQAKDQGPVVMSNAQVRAALGLLAKVLPDLKESDVHHHTATPESPEAMVQRLTALLGKDNAVELLQRIGWQGQKDKAVTVEVVSLSASSMGKTEIPEQE